MTAVVDLVPIPRQMIVVPIASSDTNPIPLITAVAGKKVRFWGFTFTGGTSFVFKDDTTAISGTITTTGQQVWPLPAGDPLRDQAFPYVQSSAGKTLNIVPTASGLNGLAFITQD